jgi:hypothetical protein
MKIEAVVNLGFLHEDMQLIGVLDDLGYEITLNAKGGFISHAKEDLRFHFNLEAGKTLVESVISELERMHPNVDVLITEDTFNALSWKDKNSRRLLLRLAASFEVEKAIA